MPVPLPIVLALPLVVTVMLLLRAEAQTPRNKPQIKLWKPLSTIFTIAIAALSFAQPHHHPVYSVLIVVGLVASLAGDWLLIDQDERPFNFVYGLVAFLIGHVCYIAAFAFARDLLGVPANPARDIAIAALLLMLGGVMYVYLRPSLGNYTQPVLLYITVISLMVHQATIGVELGRGVTTQGALAAGGALLFYASDFMLAINKFVFDGEGQHNSIWVLSTYYAAQFLIALSASLVR